MPSSVIRAFAYDPASRTLAITFTSGRRYRYFDVPAQTHAAMRAAFSKGEFFNLRIKPHFRCEPAPDEAGTRRRKPRIQGENLGSDPSPRQREGGSGRSGRI